jgi:hypothetical protein
VVRVGRHLAPEAPPPPKDKPRYRFLVAIGGIAALALLTMAIVAAVFPEQRPPEAAAGTGEPFPSGGGTTATGAPSSASPPVPSPLPAPSDKPSSTTAPPVVGPPPTGPVAGVFAVVQTWDTGFIGGVQLTNTATTAEAWQVTLVLPASVGELRASWVEGGPGIPAASRSGQTVTFRADAPLAAGVQVGLRFQFDRAPGPIAPLTCTVNGRACG